MSYHSYTKYNIDIPKIMAMTQGRLAGHYNNVHEQFFSICYISRDIRQKRGVSHFQNQGNVAGHNFCTTCSSSNLASQINLKKIHQNQFRFTLVIVVMDGPKYISWLNYCGKFASIILNFSFTCVANSRLSRPLQKFLFRDDAFD